MPVFSPITIAILISSAISLIFYAVLVKRPALPVRAPGVTDQSLSIRIMEFLSGEISTALPESVVNKLRKRQKIERLLRRSGNPWHVNPIQFHMYEIVATFLGFIASWVIWAGLNLSYEVAWYYLVPIITLMGALAPRYHYRALGKVRDFEFKKQLPDALDYIIVSLSTGQTFVQALDSAIIIMRPGVLKDEFKEILITVQSGQTLSSALDRFAERAPAETIETFVKALKQATALNVPLTETLQQRASASRLEYTAFIDKKIAELGPKMMAALTPTMTLALMVMVMSPFLIKIMETMTGAM